MVAPLRRRVASWRAPSPPSSLRAAQRPAVSFPHHDPWNTQEDIRKGRFCFLNEEAILDRPVDWEASQKSLLWRFTLHYFHYLHLLDREEQVALCREWIAENPVGEGVGWHPYPTSLRLVNWCRAELAASDLLESLYRQAAYLSRTVETHVYGNHLLENARALVLAGCYLQGQGEADQWIEQGLSIYRDALAEQILSDGFHFERSPMYHALVLEGMLDVLNVLPEDRAAPLKLREAAQAMAGGLAGATHPDGSLALFNDATHEIPLPPKRLLQYAQGVLGCDPSPRSAFSEAGYYVLDTDDLWIMIDGGPAGPEYLMAHAHADIFSYELSLFGERFVVDSGVYQYATGPMRDYVRSTAAHNTVQIDGANQIECWDAFRVARRDAPRKVQWERSGSGVEFKGIFNGYRQVLGDELSHHRHLEVDTDTRTVHVDDRIEGHGTHWVESRIHFHPEVEVHRETNGFRVRRGTMQVWLDIEHGHVRRERGWYCPGFGVRHRTCVLVVEAITPLPTRLSYRIRY